MKDIYSWISRGRALLLLFCLLNAFPAHAEKTTDNPTLKALVELYENSEYQVGLDRAKLALASTRLPKRDRAALLLFEGIFLYQLRKQDEAGTTVDEAFRLDTEMKPLVKVPPKIEAFIESRRPKPVPFNPRRNAWMPAAAGGALTVAGGILVGLSRNDANQLRHNDLRIASQADVDVLASRGQTRQTLGYSLLGVGVAGLATAAGMYLWGGPKTQVGVSLGVGMDGTSALVYGRWP